MAVGLRLHSMADSLAIIYRDWGWLDEALEHAQESVETKERLGLLEVLPWAYHQLAAVQYTMGDSAVFSGPESERIG